MVPPTISARLDLLDQSVCDLREVQSQNFAAYEIDKILVQQRAQ